MIAASLVAASFIITRLPFFLHFPLVDVDVDYWSYFDVVQQARQGQWPKLYLRTPGYPLFLAAVFTISRSAMAVVIAQCIVTLASALSTLACFVCADRRLAYPAAFALIGFTASTHSVHFDTALISESLYCSMLILSVGTLALAILRERAWACAVVSLAMSGCMLTRPAGFFLFGIYGLVLGWLILRRRPRRVVLAFALPLPIIFLALCAYNRLTVGSFTVTPFGGVNMLGAVATYIEEDPDAPAAVNSAVREIRNAMTPEDRAVILTSHDPDELYRAFFDQYDSAIYKHMAKVPLDYMELTRIYKRLARLSISRHPDIYLKFVAVNFYKFFDHALLAPDFYHELCMRHEWLYAQRGWPDLPESERKDLLMEYWNPAPQPHVWREGAGTAVDNTWSRRLHERFNKAHAAIFSRAVWFLAALLLLPVTIWKLVRSHMRDARAFLVFVSLSALIGSGLLVALVQMGLTRYGATVLFLGYLAPLYLCLLARPKNGPAAEHT